MEKILEDKLQKCQNMDFKLQKEECLFNYITQKLYWEEESTLDDLEICGTFEERPRNKAECIWVFAMKTHDESLCDLVEFEPTDSDDYLDGKTCKQSLSYTYEDASWTLKSGFPPTADPSSIQYEGSAEIRGWIVEEPIYVGEAVEQFKIHPDDAIKLPPSFQSKEVFQIKNYLPEKGYIPAEDEVFTQLREYSQSNPATVKISAVYKTSEGTPAIGLEEVTN